MTQHKQAHRIKSHGRTSHHIALHQNRSHHHHGTAEGSFTAKKWFGHRAGRSPCAHSIGKFFLCYIVFFLLKLPPPARPGTTCNIYIITKMSFSLPAFCALGISCLKFPGFLIKWLIKIPRIFALSGHKIPCILIQGF